jgi:hypothetical protein
MHLRLRHFSGRGFRPVGREKVSSGVPRRDREAAKTRTRPSLTVFAPLGPHFINFSVPTLEVLPSLEVRQVPQSSTALRL